MADTCTKQALTPESVKAFTCPTSGYVTKLSDNHSSLEFLEFMIKDQASEDVFFEVKRDQTQQPPSSSLPDDLPPDVEDMIRHVRYSVPKKMLQCKVIETRLKFSLGCDVANLRLCERHFFKVSRRHEAHPYLTTGLVMQDKFIKEYDIEFGPCKAGDGHSWNAEYTMPEDSPEQIAEYVSTPGGHRTDSFYFVGDRIVVHNKATFTYIEDADSAGEPASQASTAAARGMVEDVAMKAALPSHAKEADALADEIGKLQSA